MLDIGYGLCSMTEYSCQVFLRPWIVCFVVVNAQALMV